MSDGSGLLGPDAGGSGAVRRALRWYLLWSLVALLVVGGGVVYVSSLIAKNEALRDAERQARNISESIVRPLANHNFHDRQPAAVAAMAEALQIRAQDGSLLHVKLWEDAGNCNGRIVYADEPQLLGKVFELEEDECPLFGTTNIVTSISDLTKAENSTERTAGQLVEVYAGTADVTGTPLLFEGYIDTTALREDTRLLRGELVPVTLGALLLLFLASLPLAISLARRVDRSQAERRRLLNNAIASSDLERRRIAQDLHDGVIQDLAGVGYSLSSMTRQLPEDAEWRGQLEEANGIVRRDVASLRTLMTDIYPPDLDDRGLGEAVRELLEQEALRAYQITYDVDEPLTPSPSTARLAFRVVREALRNVVKHSKATHVTVRLSEHDGLLQFEVHDDGVGFDESVAAAEGHFGLRLVQETVADAGGHLDVSSRPGAGVHVVGTLPV